MAGRVFVVGGAHTPFIGKGHPDFIWKRHPDFGVRENPTLRDHLTQAVTDASEATGISPERAERAFLGNFVGELFVNQGHLGAALAGVHPGLAGKPSMRVEGACASGGLAMSCAVDAIRGGANVVLVAGVEVQTTASARQGGDFLARAADYPRQRGIDDFTFPALFAARTMAYRQAHGLTEAQLGHVAVKAYDNANRNPLAHMHARKMTLDFASGSSDKNPQFLQHPELKGFMKVTDCSQVSDGASAMYLVSQQGLKDLGISEADAIELVGLGVSTSSLYEDADPATLSTTSMAAERAYQAAGLSASDVAIAEVHDCFTITELMMMEALGLAPTGQAVDMVMDGSTGIEGTLPVNTGGGLVGFGHPVGATGVKQVVEIWRQMKGRCGDYQVRSGPSIGLTANMGGDDKTAVVGIYQNLG